MNTKKFIVIEYEDYSTNLTIRQYERLHQMMAAVDDYLKKHELGYLDIATFDRRNQFEIVFTCNEAETAFWAVAPIMYQYDFMIDGNARNVAPGVYLVHGGGDPNDDYQAVSVTDYLEHQRSISAEPQQMPLIECVPARGEGGLFAALKQKFLGR